MINKFKALKSLNSFLKLEEIKTDNLVFRLHCVLTTVILIVSSVVLTTTQLIGKPIECFGSGKIAKPVTTFCWTMSTFAMADEFHRKVGKEVAQPGILNEYSGTQRKKYYTYYQWVCFVLFLQAIMCYIPKKLLEISEGGLLAKLATGMNAFCPSEVLEKKKKAIVQYLDKYRKEHKTYAVSCWACELLCLANVILQMWLMDAFLDGQFWTFGTRVLQHSNLPQHERFDPMIYIFPRVTKCTFYKFGPGGGIQNIDVLCLLPQNIANEKIYIFLWFWYIILAVALALLIVFRMMIVFMPSLRSRLLQMRSHNFVSADIASVVTRGSDFGDWWLLYRLAKNMDPFIYRDIVSQLTVQIIKKHPKKLNSYAYSSIPCQMSPKT